MTLNTGKYIKYDIHLETLVIFKLITDIADRTKITKFESPANSDGKCLTTDD
jgi:hypothetical protein